MKLSRILGYMKKSIIVYVALITISFIFMGSYIYNNDFLSCELSVFDLIILPIGGGMLGKTFMIFPIIIIFIILIMQILEYDNSRYIVVRAESKSKIWIEECKKIIVFSFIYSVVVILLSYIISGLIIGGFQNNWGENNSLIFTIYNNHENWNTLSRFIATPRLLLFIFTALFLGLSAVGLIIGFLRTNMKNKYVYLIIITIVLLDGINDSYSLILNKMSLDIFSLLEPKIIIANFIFLIVINIVAFILGKGSVGKVDFFN